LVEFLRDSPLATAIRNGDLPEDTFERRRDMGRDVDL
jgi:hypothetical protein